MSLDERAFDHLIEESQDLQSDALRASGDSVAELTELREERRSDETDPEETTRLVESRKDLVSNLGRKGALVGGLGAAIAAILAVPAAADTDLDTQILQTASSLEILAVATYGAALTLPFIKDGNPVIVTFAKTTMGQHDDHRQAFQAQTTALGGKKQKKPNPKYAPIVEAAKPTLQSPLDVVSLAATLEQVATETYLSDMAQFSDTKSKKVMASVMGVESQHLATLRAVKALLEGGAPQLIAIPTDAAALPAAAGSVAFPDAFQGTSMASPATEGAVQ